MAVVTVTVSDGDGRNERNALPGYLCSISLSVDQIEREALLASGCSAASSAISAARFEAIFTHRFHKCSQPPPPSSPRHY